MRHNILGLSKVFIVSFRNLHDVTASEIAGSRGRAKQQQCLQLKKTKL